MSLVWVVWYLTRVPCDPVTAVIYQCNPGAVARYIDADTLTRCIASGSITATLTGGVDALMFARERRERIAAEQRLEEERRRADERIEELMNDLREERRQSAATQQAMLATIAELSSRVTASEQRNGSDGEDSAGK